MSFAENDQATPELVRLRARMLKIANEKSYLELIVRLIQRIDPIPGIQGMLTALLNSIVEIVGGTDIQIYYWIEDELHFLNFSGEQKILETIDDPSVQQVVEHHQLVEEETDKADLLVSGYDFIHSCNWTFPLLEGDNLIGVIKLDNIHFNSEPLRKYLPIFFSHAALILSNEIRNFSRKKAEAALREKTEELNSYFNNAMDLFCIADIEGQFLKLNPAWQHTLGFSLAELENHKFMDFIHPDDRESTTDIIARLAGQKNIANFINRYRHKNGSYRWLEWNAQPNGKLIYAAAHDITERKRLELDLRQSEHKLMEILENVSAFIYLKDLQGRYIFANRPVRELWNVHSDDIIGYGDEKFFDAESVLTIRENDRRVLVNGETIRCEETNTVADTGQTRTYWSVKLPLREENGRIYALCGISTDITERIQSESILREAKELAEHVARSKTEFVANMSHEIRTPMNGIIGLTQLAMNQPTTPKVRDYLSKVLLSSQSLLGILNDVLDFSKIEAGRMVLESMPFALDTVLDNLRNLFEERARAKQLDFSIVVEDGIPLNLIGDAMRLQQILANLLGNAIKFTEHGYVALTVALKQRDDKEATLNFTVKDTGIGIDEVDLDKLFQPFSQVDGSITRRFGGSGLGLAISNNLLQMMHGQFEIDSQLGQGSTFAFDVTLKISSNGRSRLTRRRQNRQAGVLSNELAHLGDTIYGSRILVVEDNLINQQVVKEFLNLSGVDVDVANNGQEALAKVAQQTYDAVLMDIQMPIMGGIEATQVIRKQECYAELPIIALSAGVTLNERKSCLAHGMNDFIAKPVNPEDLIVALTRWIQPKARHHEVDAVVCHETSWADLYELLPDFDLSNLQRMLGGNRHILVSLFAEFYHDVATYEQQVLADIDNGSYDKAEKLIHKLKGAAGNLGAVALQRISETLDQELKGGRCCPATLNAWQVIFTKTLAAITQMLNRLSRDTTAIAQRDAVIPRQALIELDRLLAENSFINSALLEQIQGNMPAKMFNEFETAIRCIHDIEYVKARMIIQKILAE